jgi:hypothetical protein
MTLLLRSVTGPTAQTQFTRFDERWDVPILKDVGRLEFYKSWLESVGAPTADQWSAIRRNWISFLSATSTRPNADLAPNRKRPQNASKQLSAAESDIERFQHDRRVRAAIQVAVFDAFGMEERKAERWPRQARLIVNRACCPTATESFRTICGKANLGKRSRYQAVWASLICFLVYAYENVGMLEEMGLSLAEITENNVVDVLEDIQDGIQRELEGSVAILVLNIITPTASNSPVLWWLKVLVRSAIDPLQEIDYISRGRFLMNILPTDVDLYGRIEAIQYYAKVFVLEKAMSGWGPRPWEWYIEVKNDLDNTNLAWLDEDSAQPPADDSSSINCESPAWISVLENLNRWAIASLSNRKDIDTVLGEVWKLLSADTIQ